MGDAASNVNRLDGHNSWQAHSPSFLNTDVCTIVFLPPRYQTSPVLFEFLFAISARPDAWKCFCTRLLHLCVSKRSWYHARYPGPNSITFEHTGFHLTWKLSQDLMTGSRKAMHINIISYHIKGGNTLVACCLLAANLSHQEWRTATMIRHPSP